jgi:hypothetical protein
MDGNSPDNKTNLLISMLQLSKNQSAGEQGVVLVTILFGNVRGGIFVGACFPHKNGQL